MNIRQFECFNAVLTAGTMTQAAEILGISQPAISNSIASLEHELGFTLFKRRRGRLQPTSEALSFYENVKRTLESFSQTEEAAQQIRNRELGHLVVATYPGIAISFLPAVISEFLASRPAVRLRVISRSSQTVRELIPTQQFDVGIAELPVDHPAVETEEFSFDCLCAMPRQHPLAKRRVITPRDIDGVPFVSLYKEHMTHFRLAKAFFEANAVWNVVAETEFFATNHAFVASGGGVAVIDPLTAAHAGGDVVTRPFRPRIPYEIGLLYPTHRPRSRLLDEFVGLFRRRIASFIARR